MQEDDLAKARILMVDDHEVNIRLVEHFLLSAGYTCIRAIQDPREAEPLFVEFQPDLVVLDLQMPYMDGFQVLDALRPHIPETTYLPILVLTADVTPEAKQKALSRGAKDFLVKPFNSTEILLRIRNLLETRFLHLQLQSQKANLEVMVRERTAEVEEAHRRLLQAEVEKKRFYRDVILAVTNNKFHLLDTSELPLEGELVMEAPVETPMDYPGLRRRLRELMEPTPMAAEALDDLILAVGEAVTNAIKHAVAGRCAVYLTAESVLVRVSDRGAGIRTDDLPGSILGAGFSTQISLGMGYTMMLQLVDRVWLATSPEGTIVQIKKWLHPEEHVEEPLAGVLDRF